MDNKDTDNGQNANCKFASLGVGDLPNMFVEKGCFVNIHARLDQETGRAGEGMADDDTWSGGGTWYWSEADTIIIVYNNLNLKQPGHHSQQDPVLSSGLLAQFTLSFHAIS